MRRRFVALVSLLGIAVALYGGLYFFEKNLQGSIAAIQPQYGAGRDAQGPIATEFDRLNFIASVGRDSDLANPQIEDSADTLRLWQRESWFIDVNNYLRMGTGPVLGGTYALPKEDPKGNPVRILAVGDSFLFGMGTADTDIIWVRQLERQLNEIYGDQTFRVDILAQSGASTMEEVGWLTAAQIAKYQPDAILVSYIANDPMPSFREPSICGNPGGACVRFSVETSPAFRACLAGEEGAVGVAVQNAIGDLFPAVTDWVLKRYCDPERFAVNEGLATEEAVKRNPQANPYWPYFVDALERLNAIAQTTPVAVVQTVSDSFDHVGNIFGEYGLIAMPWSADIARAHQDLPPIAQVANPVDGHHGAGTAKLVASMVARDIESLVPPERIVEAQQAAAQPERPMVSNVLPAWLRVETGTDSAVVANDYGQSIPDFVNQIYNKVAGPQQYAGCLPVSRPHARVMLDPYRAGQPILVRHNTGADLLVYSAGYDDQGTPTYQEEGVLKAGGELELAGDSVRHGLIFSGMGPDTCGLDSTPSLEAFTVELSYVP